MPAEIHNEVGPARLALRPGDAVGYERDDGTIVHRNVRWAPELLGGHTWVVWLHGESGCVALCRCHPAPVFDAASFANLPERVPNVVEYPYPDHDEWVREVGEG